MCGCVHVCVCVCVCVWGCLCVCVCAFISVPLWCQIVIMSPQFRRQPLISFAQHTYQTYTLTHRHTHTHTHTRTRHVNVYHFEEKKIGSFPAGTFTKASRVMGGNRLCAMGGIDGKLRSCSLENFSMQIFYTKIVFSCLFFVFSFIFKPLKEVDPFLLRVKNGIWPNAPGMVTLV